MNADRKKSPAEKAGESKSDKAKSVRKYTKKRSGCHYNQSLSALRTAFSITVAPSVQCSGLEYSGSQCERPSFDCTNIIVVGSIYAANCAS